MSAFSTLLKPNGDIRTWKEILPGEMTRQEYEELLLRHWENTPSSICYAVNKADISGIDLTTTIRTLSAIKASIGNESEWNNTTLN
jgi:hypothetical protein